MTIRERDIADEVGEELSRQRELWGEQNHSPLKWLAILMEEVGEAATDALNASDLDNYRTEMVQVAAVAIAAIASFDRGKRHENM